ncbi:hypothetical protein [Fodinicola acaciae]|nr:hypothetical protein [Fodinicola acaciae]
MTRRSPVAYARLYSWRTRGEGGRTRRLLVAYAERTRGRGVLDGS